MKRIKEYRKLFNADAKTELKELKKTYRSLVKEWHPDKFQEGDERAAEAEVMGQKIIDAYHFLVSIAPETKAANQADYDQTISESGIKDYNHKGLVLTVSFMDGSTYEYFGVTHAMYVKFVNADRQQRFAKRNIFNSYLYRKSMQEAVEA